VLTPAVHGAAGACINSQSLKFHWQRDNSQPLSSSAASCAIFFVAAASPEVEIAMTATICDKEVKSRQKTSCLGGFNNLST
jgi:hypothetical protein